MSGSTGGDDTFGASEFNATVMNIGRQASIWPEAGNGAGKGC